MHSGQLVFTLMQLLAFMLVLHTHLFYWYVSPEMLSATGIYVSYVNPIVTFYGKFTSTHVSVKATWSLQTFRLS